MPKISFETPVKTRRKNQQALAAAAAIIAAAALQDVEVFAPLRAKLQDRTFQVGEREVSKLHFLLAERGFLNLARKVALPSTMAIPGELVADGLPTISIVTDESGLYSPSGGIIANPLEKGRRWERWAYVSYFEGAELKYETPAGLRVHGGTSRLHRIKSFDLIFRRTYSGSPRAKQNIFFEGNSPPIQRLVLSNTDEEMRLLNPLALEIAERAGCITSRRQAVRVVLNGKRIPCGYFALEHQSREFLRHRFGHDDFHWMRLKGESVPPLSFKFLAGWLRLRSDSVTMEAAADRFHIDDICAWVFAITFCNTQDGDQGGYYLDRSATNAVWRSLSWDMDRSFNLGNMESSSFDLEDVRGLRAQLFKRLCENDPRFRAYFRNFAETALRERLSPEILQELVEKYRNLVRTDIFISERHRLLQALDNAEKFLVEHWHTYLDGLDRYYSTFEANP